ncbi:MAG: IS5/IS1182 family transposase, partial [Phormidesmis sp. CAN_BIN36]|nr:IS5/IS1182 family transposase [Phormidesmis sp. CAN_BIN36]
LQDKGYQGIQKLHSNSRLPLKKPKGGSLSPEDKAQNYELAAERYRNRRRRYGLRCNLIAASYNYELSLQA